MILCASLAYEFNDAVNRSGIIGVLVPESENVLIDAFYLQS